MIPKIIHVSWNDRGVAHSTSPMVTHGLRKLIDLNPDWDVQISTDEEVANYLAKSLSEDDYSLVKNIGIVPQTDIWRLLKLYNEGGVYIDIDRLCNKKLSDVAAGGVKWVLPTCGDYDFSHDFMMTAPGNPVYDYTIALYLDRRRKGCTDTYYLGAQTYMHGITYAMWGQIIDPNPGKEVFDLLRKSLSNTGFISVYKENLPEDSIIYKGDISYSTWADMKKSFYAENNIRHWTNEW